MGKECFVPSPPGPEDVSQPVSAPPSSLWPSGLQSARFPLGMKFPGSNTGVGCYFFSRGPSWSRDRTHNSWSPVLAGGFFTTWEASQLMGNGRSPGQRVWASCVLLPMKMLQSSSQIRMLHLCSPGPRPAPCDVDWGTIERRPLKTMRSWSGHTKGKKEKKQSYAQMRDQKKKKKKKRERDKEKRYKPSWKKLKEKGVKGMDNAAVSSCPGESFCLRLQVSSPPPLPSVRRKWKTSSSGAKGLTQKTIFKKEKQKRKNIHLDTGKKIKDNCRDLSTYMCMYIYIFALKLYITLGLYI